MRLRAKGEGSSFTVVLAFTNESDEQSVMSAVKYRIDCLTTGRTVRDWTSITPALEMEVDVTPEDNVIFRDRDRYEDRQLTVVANDDTDQQFVDPDPIVWTVRNVLPGRVVLP